MDSQAQTTSPTRGDESRGTRASSSPARYSSDSSPRNTIQSHDGRSAITPKPSHVALINTAHNLTRAYGPAQHRTR
jgi:hypothetical protein